MAFDYIWLTDKLKGEYKETFDKAEIYANMRAIDEDTQNDMMMELLDLFLTAQNEGKPVDKLVGRDVETFCHSFFGNYEMKNYWKKVPEKIYRLFWSMFVLEWIFYFTSEEELSLLHGTVDVSAYMAGILVGLLVWVLCNACIRPFLFRWRWLTSGRFSAIVLILTVGMIVASVMLLDDFMLPLSLPILGVFLVTGGYIMIYIIVRSIYQYRRYGSIRKQKSEMGKGGFRQFIKETVQEVVDEMPDDLVERFHDMNRKRQKKGKEPMTPYEYMEQLRRENIRAEKADFIGPGIVLLVVIGIIFHTALTSTFFDTLVFIVVMAAAEIPAMFLFRVGRKTTKRRIQLVEECDRCGMTILEYAERKKENRKEDSHE